MAPSAKCPTVDFGSGQALGMEPDWDSLSKIKKKKERKKKTKRANKRPSSKIML